MSLTSNPPCDLGAQFFLHPTQDIFSLPSNPPQKNFLCNPLKILETPSGILKKDKKKSGKDVSTKLIKQIWPAKGKCLRFHDASFFLNFVIIGFQVYILLEFVPMEIPK